MVEHSLNCELNHGAGAQADDGREEKLRQRDKLRDLCSRFAASGLDAFGDGLQGRPWMGTGTRGHSGGAMKKLIDEVQGIGRSSRHVPALRRLSLRKEDAAYRHH